MTQRLSMAEKPSTFTFEGKAIAGVPQKDWPYEQSLAWLNSKRLPPSSKIYINVAKLYSTTVAALIRDAKAEPSQDLPNQLPNLTPNISYGPLTLEQKQEIYDHHYERPTRQLAYLYGTNTQNIRLAKQKRAEPSTPGRRRDPEVLSISPFTPSTKYGPLTLEQQEEIYEHHASLPPAALARTYATSTYYVKQAQLGKLKRSDSATTNVLIKAADILGVELSVLTALSETAPCAAVRIARALSKGTDDFEALCIKSEAPTVLKHYLANTLTIETLEPLYMYLTEFNGELRYLRKILKSHSIHLKER